ncbi:Tn3 family transposase [Streptomyces sp. NBC_00445]
MAAYERIERDVLQRRLLLALFALGTNMGTRAIVATGEHGESEAALRHVRRHFITVGRTSVSTPVQLRGHARRKCRRLRLHRAAQPLGADRAAVRSDGQVRHRAPVG